MYAQLSISHISLDSYHSDVYAPQNYRLRYHNRDRNDGGFRSLVVGLLIEGGEI